MPRVGHKSVHAGQMLLKNLIWTKWFALSKGTSEQRNKQRKPG